MKRVLILTSPTTSKNISQSSIFYLAEFLSKKDMEIDILDLSGIIDFYDPPREMLENQTDLWQSPLIFDENWIDNYIPKYKKEYDCIYASSLFSMDIILQGRYVKKCKENNSRVKAVIGGSAIKNLNATQLKLVASVFDEVFEGFLPVFPNYNLDLYTPKEFVTIATGTGCDWGKCRFCNSGKEKYSLKSLNEIVKELLCVSKISRVSHVMLSSDSIPIFKISDLSLKLLSIKSTQKYNLMLRADKKINKDFSENLRKSGCSDIFIGTEILDDNGLILVNKGTTIRIIKDVVRNLSSSGIEVQIGLIMFLPCITEFQLENQLSNLEEILPYISRVEVESLSVLYNSDFYNNSTNYEIELYPEKNLIFPAWCYGLSPDIPWGFKNDVDYFKWEEHIKSLRQLLSGYVDKEYWWHIDYIKENWE